MFLVHDYFHYLTNHLPLFCPSPSPWNRQKHYPDLT